jgi:alginate O-acetyltransferase complex protein AlgI
MLFNSIQFIFFFIIVTSVYFAIPHKFRWFLLLTSSCYFYMAFIPVYILILGFTIVIDYFAGIYLEKTQGKTRKYFLILSLIANIGILCVFKYFNFLNENVSYLLNNFGYQNPIPFLKILLPIGLSFHTFQAMSYTIEVYRGKQKAEHNFGIYALYVMFYPQLVAGPIERPQNILHQFYEKHVFSYNNAVQGLKLIVWGFFKKLVVADRIAIYVSAVYHNPQQQSGITLLVATLLFSFQIYCDFSGYSDIAIGVARFMGFKLMTNFNRPYFSRTISEFWRRWHISLSTWFTDYLYISLGGNRVSIPRWYFNLFFTFLVSGLWHGANWTFILWGALNGVYLISGILLKPFNEWVGEKSGIKKYSKLNRLVQMLITFILISIAWVLFRANNISDAAYILKHMFTFKGPLYYNDNPSIILYPIVGIAFLLFVESNIEFHHKKLTLLKNKGWFISNVMYAVLVIIILMIGVFDGGQFIYFQF